MLALTDGPPGSAVEYVTGGTALTGADRECAAQGLADDAMVLRAGASSPSLARWRAVRDGDPPDALVSAAAVASYIAVGFGLPDKPAPPNHLQGLVAELIWNRLIKERTKCSGGRTLVHAHSVKPDPLEPGGDGLVIYQVGQMHVFRLWEIKKHDAQGYVSATINRASAQLASRGNEYLAKLAGPETVDQPGPIGAFYGQIVELWLGRSDRAGVGVSVGTSDTHMPASHQSFGSIASTFPQFDQPGQAEAVVIGVPDFPGFAVRVREVVWSGL
jgi:hypothetical protein